MTLKRGLDAWFLLVPAAESRVLIVHSESVDGAVQARETWLTIGAQSWLFVVVETSSCCVFLLVLQSVVQGLKMHHGPR